MAYGSFPGVPPPVAAGIAGVAPVRPWYRRTAFRVALITVGVGTIAVAGLVMYGLLGLSFGPEAFLLAIGAAILPVPVVLACFVWLDRYEPEPWHYLAFVFGWGACVATAAALVFNKLGGALLVGPESESPAVAVFVAPPVEEFFKALPLFILLALTLFGRHQIHGVVDGMVYAGVSAVGFAFTENVLYFGTAYVEAGAEGGRSAGLGAVIVVFVLRGVLSPFAHPLFTCMTGIGIGIAVRNRNWAIRILAPLVGLGVAIALHASWNGLATVTANRPELLLAGYFGFMVPVFLVMVTIAVVIRGREARVVGRILPGYAARGWFNPQEIAALRTMANRRAGRRWARRLAGPSGARAMAQYQFAATKLAILRDGLLRGLAGRDYAEQERELLHTLAARRLYIVQNARHPHALGVPAYGAYGGPFRPTPPGGQR